MTTCPLDGTIGPAIGPCRGGFDFTLTFEESILGLAPQIILLLLTPIRFLTLRRRRVKLLKSSHLGFLKGLSTILYVLSSLLSLVLWSRHESYKTKTSVAFASIQLVGAMAIAVLSRLEHTRAMRPSHVLQFFLLIMLLCSAVRLRTLFLMRYSNDLVVSASIHTFLTAILLLLESLDKTPLIPLEPSSRRSPEETLDIFAKGFFWHLNGLFWTGYRKVLNLDDLYSLSEELSSDRLRDDFKLAWNQRQSKSGRYAIYETIWSVLRPDILFPIIPKLIYVGTNLAQPYLITAMIVFIEDAHKSGTKNDGYGLIAAFALNYTLMAVCNSWYAQSMARFSTKLRSCLVSLVYHHTLEIHPQDADVGAGTVLMNVDVEKVMMGSTFFHDFWAQLLTCGIALFILYTHLGVTFILPLVTSVVMAVACFQIGTCMKPRQSKWTGGTQKRVTAISYAAGSMKAIRMLGLTGTVRDDLTKLREEEVGLQLSVRRPLLAVITLSNCSFQITALVTYVTYVAIALSHFNEFNLLVLFGSLASLSLVTTPLATALQFMAIFSGSMASLERIQSYLRGDIVNLMSREHEDESSSGKETNNIRMKTINGASSTSVVHLDGASFGVHIGQPILKDLNLRISHGTLNMVLGQVGSGKTLLLRSLIGEMWHDQGLADYPSTGVAFCAQTPWLRNVSIRENILGENIFEEDWYATVVWSCALDKDFEELAKGDMTLIGSKGISLSGGQKNRIALARALYSRNSTLILDDILSGLDKTTEMLVFRRVFARSGLLRRSKSTVILATHSSHWASEADEIITMSAGTILEQGAIDRLTNAAKLGLLNLNKSQLYPISSADSIQNVETANETTRKPTNPTLSDNSKLLNQERRSGDKRSFAIYLASVGIFQVTLYMVLLLFANGTGTAQFVWLKYWAQSADSARAALIRNMVIFILITVVNIVLMTLWLGHSLMVFQPRSSLTLHAKQLKALMNASFSFIVATDVGSIANRFSQDMVLIDGALPIAWLNVTGGACKLLAELGIIAAATPPVAAIIPFMAAVCYLIQRVYLRTSRQIRLMDLEAKAPLCTHFLETLAGITTIRAFGWSSKYRRRSNELLDASQVPFYLLYAIQNWLKLVLELMVAGIVTVVVGVAVALRGRIDAGFLGLALVGVMDLGFWCSMFVQSWTSLETSLSAISRVRQFSDETPKEEDETKARFQTDMSWPVEGTVSYRNFTASYSPEGESVVKGICLDITDGEKVGICGRTGSGKSSLVASLFGLLHQQSGSIDIDHVVTTSMSLATLRSKIVSLPQEPFLLLNSSVRSNLRPWVGNSVREVVDDQLLIQALEDVGLWKRMVEICEGGEGSVLDAAMHDVEDSFSQGEKQLFCLARAMVTEGKIVVLDEATSSVDAATDTLMQDVLRRAFKNRTIIAIAHRVNTIMDFDRVVVMEAGRIAEIGSPSELMNKEAGLFRTLVESQGGH